MIKFILKSQFYQKFKEFRSFFILLFLMLSTVIIINTYDKFKTEQNKYLENFLSNIYLQKTLQSVSFSLEPRFEKINYIVTPGNSFEVALKNINLNELEIKKILNFILKNKIKFNLYENQIIIFEIDNLDTRKIKKITIPITKKKRFNYFSR